MAARSQPWKQPKMYLNYNMRTKVPYEKMEWNKRNEIYHMVTMINGYAYDLRVSVLDAHFK